MASRRRTNRRRRSVLPLDHLSAEMQRHIEALRLDSVEAYLDWCRTHRFAGTWEKRRSDLLAERDYAQRLTAEKRLRVRHARTRVSRDALDRLFEGDVEGVHDEVARVAPFFADASTPRIHRDFARRLFRSVPATLLGTEVGSNGLSVAQFLIRVAGYAEHASRTLDTWRERTHNTERRMLSLVRHLYAVWDVPDCLTRAWFERGRKGDLYRRWFLHVGAGKNIRTAPDLPIAFTKKMAHWFVRAPRDYDVGEALRFGQVLGIGGDRALAEVVRSTFLPRRFGHDEFWLSVFRFFIQHPELERRQFGPIVDFLRYQRFQPQRFVRLDGREIEEPPPQPNLSMHGRTPDALLRQVEAWHARLGRAELAKGDFTWASQGWPVYRHVERTREGGVGRTWEIHELTTSAALRAEGTAMNHCVAIYARDCRERRSAILSMTCAQPDGPPRRALTIEVSLRRARVEQALGAHNRDPRSLERTHLARWAKAVGLEVADWV